MISYMYKVQQGMASIVHVTFNNSCWGKGRPVLFLYVNCFSSFFKFEFIVT